MQAMQSEDQQELIRKSLSDEALGQQCADWIGVEIAHYKEECSRALAVLERRKSQINKTYYKWEIGCPLSGAGCSEIRETG